MRLCRDNCRRQGLLRSVKDQRCASARRFCPRATFRRWLSTCTTMFASAQIWRDFFSFLLIMLRWHSHSRRHGSDRDERGRQGARASSCGRRWRHRLDRDTAGCWGAGQLGGQRERLLFGRAACLVRGGRGREPGLRRTTECACMRTDTRVVSQDGATPLVAAAGAGQVDALRMLLAGGANAEARTKVTRLLALLGWIGS